jgi:hypothetical protein
MLKANNRVIWYIDVPDMKDSIPINQKAADICRAYEEAEVKPTVYVCIVGIGCGLYSYLCKRIPCNPYIKGTKVEVPGVSISSYNVPSDFKFPTNRY